MKSLTTNTTHTATILVFGSNGKVVNPLRATLESAGHIVVQEKSLKEVETKLYDDTFDVVFVSNNTDESTEFFETLSLVSEEMLVIGFSTTHSQQEAMQFIRCGGSDYFSFPEEFSVVNKRLQILLEQREKEDKQKTEASNAMNTISKMEEENDALNQELAHNFCEIEKKMELVAAGAEFQTLVSQELEVESMLRTALGYMLTKVGAMNAAVYLREGTADWGVGAFINYDRQPEEFQSLLDVVGPAVCHTLSTKEHVQHDTNGETFANEYGLDSEDFAGSEVVTCGCFDGDTCMAVAVFFRDNSRPFDVDAVDIIETLRSVFGEQLGTILRIHKRATTNWPTETYGDDDWSIDKAA